MDRMSHPDEQHGALQLLLPWYAGGRLDASEHARVADHLERCASCREALLADEALARAIVEPVPNADAGWQKLAARLDRAPIAPRQRRRERTWSRATDRAPRRLHWLVAGQTAAIAMLAAWIAVPLLTSDARDESYRALSAGAPTIEGNVLAMFRPTATEAQLRQLLTASGARVVNGPTSAGAYVLAAPAEGAALAALRRDPIVTMAEPIGAPVAP